MNHPRVCCQLPYKSVAAAVALSFFLSVFGVLYASFWWGAALTILMLAVSEIPKIGTYCVLIIWGCCPFISVYFVERYNRRLYEAHHTV